jgi:hypothetical protein
MSEAQQQTSEIARTPTGEIKDVGQTTAPETMTPQTSTTTETSASPETEGKSPPSQSGTSLANQLTAGAPEAYDPFTVPEGFELSEGVQKEAGELFKAMNLTQGDAQKLVDFYSGKTLEAVNAPYDAWRKTQEEWVKQVKADPNIGSRLSEVTQTISRAIDSLGDAKLASEFRAAMDYTGAGNNPAFIKAFYKLAQRVTEGGHVAGRGPSAAGQQRPGTTAGMGARAMFPNLP